MPDINPNVAGAFIAAISAVLGAMIGFASKARSAAQKFRELQYEHERRSRDGYLAAARAYTGGIYVPLSISVSFLRKSFDSYLGSKAKSAERKFNSAVHTFSRDVDALLERGASAFLTTGLDETLTSFLVFLKNSLNSSEARQQIIFSYRLPYLSGPFPDKAVETRRIEIPQVSINLLGVGLSVREIKIIEAPIHSKEFRSDFRGIFMRSTF